MSTRKITVFSTAGRSGKVIETDSLNWGALQTDLKSQGVSFSGMKAVVGKTRVNLEHSEAVLPDEDFTLFLFPEKTKSGAGLTAAQVEAMPYADLRSTLKDLAAADGERFKEHFNKDKNYTTKSTGDLKSLLISYDSGSSKRSSSKGIASTKAEANPKTSLPEKSAKTATKEIKTNSDKPARVERKAAETSSNSDLDLNTDEKKVNFIIELIEKMGKPTNLQKEEAISAIASLRAGSEVRGSRGSTSIDTNSLSREADEIRKGLSGVK